MVANTAVILSDRCRLKQPTNGAYVLPENLDEKSLLYTTLQNTMVFNLWKLNKPHTRMFITTKGTEIGPVTLIAGLNKGQFPHCNSSYIKETGLIFDSSSDKDEITAQGTA